MRNPNSTEQCDEDCGVNMMRRNQTTFSPPTTFPQLKKKTTRDRKKERALKRLKKQHTLTQLRALPLSRRVIVIVSVVLIVLLLVACLSLGGWILYRYLREPTVILLGDANQTVEAFSSYEDPGISLKLGKETVKGEW